MMDDSNGSSDSVEFPGTGNSPVINGHMETEAISDDDDDRPKLVIIEQPQQRGFRFRYECEGPSHGGLQGWSSKRYGKTVPTVKVKNFNGPVRVTVNLVTDETVPKCHAHKLVGKNCQNGTCTVEVKAGTAQIAFPNLCIQHVTRRKASEVLEQRICEEMVLNKRINVNNLSAKFQLTDEEKTNAKIQAEKQAKSMQLNVVRLCFQAFLLDNSSNPLAVLPSVVSEPIYDSKAPGANALKICRMDKYSGCCTGNDEVFLLCEKVQKDDIQVQFVEQDVEGNILWQAYGHFGPFDVHRQFAIVFKTPEYHDVTINKPVNVLVSLQRKSDGEYSDPKSFTYYPRSFDNEDIEGKRRKILPHYTDQRGGFGGMNSFSGGDSSSGGSSNGMSNGGLNRLQNGGGTIPDLKILRKFPIAAGLGCCVSEGVRKILRPISRKSAMLKNMAGSLLENPANDLTAHSSNYTCAEIQKRSSPSNTGHMQLYGSGPTQQIIGGMSTAVTTNPMSVASPYSQDSFSVSSPQNIASTYGNESRSPQRVLTSPHNIDHLQQSIAYGSQNEIIGSGNLNLPVTQSTIRPISQMTQMQTGLQMISDNLVSHQSVQGSDLGSVSLEPDYLVFDPTLQQFQYFNPNVKTFHEYSPYVYGTCAYQARGSSRTCDTDLQDVMAVLDMVDGAPVRESTDAFDEVDSAAADRMDLRTRGAGLISDKKHFLVGHLPKSSKVSNPVKENLVQNEEHVATKPVVVEKQPKITVNTSAQSEQPQKCETAVQTEMDPMIKLAMKTSQALQYYAASGDVRSILMIQRFLMAVQDTDGDLPLHTALINEKFEVFQNILDVMVTLPDAYARINAFNFHLQTPLHIAVITNQPKAVDLLIRAGADTTLVDRNGYTPAHLAVLYNYDACLMNLLKYVRPGIDPKHPFPELNTRCYDGFTPAHLAAQLENLTAMKLLVYGKTDVNLADGKSGCSPLHHSIEADDLSLAAYLILQAGANVNAKRFDGNTALHVACGRNNVGMVALLMAGGADPTIENDDPLETDSEGDSSDDNEQLTNRVSEEEKDMPKEVLDEHDDKIDGTKNEGSNMEKDPKTPCKGLLPAHFANNNEMILRVLKGEPYSSLRDSPTDQKNDRNMADKLNSMKLSAESGIDSMRGHSIGSDMNKLEYPIRLQLSELLDPSRTGCDWQALADKLGMQHLLQDDMGNNSPTRLLFTYFETNGGTISQLSQALAAIKRDDCVTLIRNLNKENERDPIFDSGVSDSFRKSSSPNPINSHTVT